MQIEVSLALAHLNSTHEDMKTTLRFMPFISCNDTVTFLACLFYVWSMDMDFEPVFPVSAIQHFILQDAQYFIMTPLAPRMDSTFYFYLLEFYWMGNSNPR